MTRFGDGLAAHADPRVAVERAAADALQALAGAEPDLAAVFVCGEDPELVGDAMQRAAEITGAAASLGCSTTGVIAAGRGLEGQTAAAVWCGVLPEARLRSFALEVMPSDAGMAVVGMPPRHTDDVTVIMLADPWSFPVDGFVEQSNDALPGLSIVGGMAAGARGRGSSRLMVDGRVVERGAVGIMVGGAVQAHAVVSQGCRPVGPAMTVTASDQNVILELAGSPAVAKLQSILAALPPDEQAMVTTGLQLGIARDEYVDEHQQGDFLIRGIAGVDEAGSGLVVGDLVPVGRTVRFQVRDAAAADHDLRVALAGFRSSVAPASIEGALLFSCNGRGAQLFGSADHDPRLVRDELVASGVAGCFAAGEIGPVAGRNFIHGFTASILAFEAVTSNGPSS